MERIQIYLLQKKMPISFIGEYLGNKRPDGKPTRNWHYYKDKDGKIYQFRKEHIQLVISKNEPQ